MEFSYVDDRKFLAAVDSGCIERFGHREHLRLAFLAAREHETLDAAVRRCRSGIRSVASAKGAPDRYNETITAAWAACVRHAARRMPEASFGEVVAAHPELEDAAHLERFYSRELLTSGAARAERLAPDLTSLPA